MIFKTLIFIISVEVMHLIKKAAKVSFFMSRSEHCKGRECSDRNKASGVLRRWANIYETVLEDRTFFYKNIFLHLVFSGSGQTLVMAKGVA